MVLLFLLARASFADTSVSDVTVTYEWLGGSDTGLTLYATTEEGSVVGRGPF